MKIIKRELDADLEEIKIELFSDLHIGSPKCDYKTLKKRIEKVAENKDTYCILVGDLINNSTKYSVGDVYEESLTPMQQINQCVTLFQPIKNKILCVTSGNHERRSYKQDGIDLVRFFCNELGISDRYDYVAPLLFLRFGEDKKKGKVKANSRKICYTIYVTHGDGQGGRTVGGKANGLNRRGNIIDADIIVTGHTHQAITFRDVRYRIDYQNSSVTEKEQVFVNTSATLDHEAYAELYGMPPTSKASPVIKLQGTHKQIEVII